MGQTTFSVGVHAQHETRAVVTLGAAVLAVLLFALFHVVPLLSLAAIVCPLPLAAHRLRGGLTAGLLATLLAAGLIGAVFSLGSALLFVAAFALPGLLIAEGLARGRGLLRGCTWAFAWLASEVVVLLLGAAPQMAALLVEPFAEMGTPRFLDELRRGGLPAERVELFAEQAQTWHAALSVVYPAAFIVLAALVVLANATLLRSYLVRRDPGWLEDGEFEELHWPLALVPVFLLAGLGVGWAVSRPLAYNVLLVLAFFFGLQGLAVLVYYAYRLAGPLFVRVGLMALMLLNPWAPQVLALVGLFDLFMDFRKWARPVAA